jgi:glycosyltransferase involved in cell wall biosynthesis
MSGPERVVFVGPKRRYHSGRSGYEALCRYFDGSPVAEVSVSRVLERGARAAAAAIPESRRRRWLGALGMRHYGRRRLLQELRTAPVLLWGRRAIVHHLYAEESYRLGGYVPRLRGSRLVGTFHMPPGRFRQHVADPSHLSRLDAAIVVSRYQEEFLGGFLPAERVFFVPHGVDVDFFCPADSPPGEFRCLFVGYFLRDFATLRRTVELLRPEGVRFELVLTPGKAQEFRDLFGAAVHAQLSDEELREAYRRASVLVLPLLDATANNALLEAMACGVPVVATDVGGVRDYCGPTHSVLVPPADPEAMARAVLALRDDPARRQALARAARERAEREFDWRIVAASVSDVYRRILP